MGRVASVRVKNGYWYSEKGGVGRYLGKVGEMTKAQATALLWNQTPTPRVVEGEGEDRGTRITVAELRDKYLQWVSRHRSDRLHDESERHLSRFCQAYGKKEAMSITGADLEAFTDRLTRKGQTPIYTKKHATSVRTMFSRGRKAGWLPANFQPFAAIEGIRLEPKPLLESDLPTHEEVARLKAKATGVMADCIAIYHATGMRTHELIEARVGDFQPKSRTIVLGRHKRSKTMKTPLPRTITLNAEAYAILERLCRGRNPDDRIIVNRNGNPYDSQTLGNRFQKLRGQAKVRDNITIYSFRHLWISEATMAGLDTLLIARMAGTSAAMLEKVYAHFRTDSLHDAQARLDAARKS